MLTRGLLQSLSRRTATPWAQWCLRVFFMATLSNVFLLSWMSHVIPVLNNDSAFLWRFNGIIQLRRAAHAGFHRLRTATATTRVRAMRGWITSPNGNKKNLNTKATEKTSRLLWLPSVGEWNTTWNQTGSPGNIQWLKETSMMTHQWVFRNCTNSKLENVTFNPWMFRFVILKR